MSNCSCPHDTDDDDDPGQNFWQKLAAKYEQRVQNLRKERQAVRQRLELLQLQMPIYLCYNLKRSPGKADQYINELMQMYMRKNEEASKCMCYNCPTKVPDNFPQNLYNYTYPQKLSTVSPSKATKKSTISEHKLRENLICDCQYCVKMVTKRLLKEKEMEASVATYSRFSEKLVAEKDTCGSNGNKCECPVDTSRAFKNEEICECSECAEEVIRRIESPDVEFGPLRCGCGHQLGTTCQCRPCKSKKTKQSKRENRTVTRTSAVIPAERKTEDTCKKGECTCAMDMPQAFKDAAICDCNICAEEVIKRIASPDITFEPLSCGCDGVLPAPVEVDIPICECNSCKLELAKRLGVKDESKKRQSQLECPCGSGMRANGDLICDCDICAEKIADREIETCCGCDVGDDVILPICSCSECQKTRMSEETELNDTFCICKCDVCNELREAAEEEEKKIKYSVLETTIKCICNCDICTGKSNEEQVESEIPCDGPSPPKQLERSKLEEPRSEECLCEEDKVKSPSEVSCTCTEEAVVEVDDGESCRCSEVVSVKGEDDESCTCIEELVTTVSGESCTCSEKSGSTLKTEVPSVTESCLCPSPSVTSEKVIGVKSSHDSSCTCSGESSKPTTPSVNSCVCLSEVEIPVESSIEMTDSCACSVSSEKLTQESSSARESEDSCTCSDKEMVLQVVPVESDSIDSFGSISEKSVSSDTYYEDVLDQSDSSCSCSEVYDIIEPIDTSCTCSEGTIESKSCSPTGTYLARDNGEMRCQTDQEEMKNCECAVPLKNCVCLIKPIATDIRKSEQGQRKLSISINPSKMIVRLAGTIRSSKSIIRRRSEPIKGLQYRKEFGLMMCEIEELRRVQSFQLKQSCQLVDDFVEKPTKLIETFGTLEHCGLIDDRVSDSDCSDSGSDEIKSEDLSVSQVYIAKPRGANSQSTQGNIAPTETTVIATTTRWILEAVAPAEQHDAKPIRRRERVYERRLSEEWLKETKSVCSCMVDLETYDSDEPPPDCATEEERCCCVRMKTDKFTKLIVEKYVSEPDERD